MHITRYTDYSLRVLIYLAAEGDRLATIQEIADSYDISKNHLMKVVHQLNKKGYIETIRGKNGGMRLHRAPEEINIGILVRETEQDLNIVECFSSRNTCKITPVCGLKSMFNEALKAFLEVLDQYTLADIVQSRHQSQLLRLLQIA
ncbi:MAG: Rrf2 family transcriptional regulator [Marinobacter sp.]|nr:Rrf2 family transcriptional regulator [Marinobacter sp.]